jgi:hypothetical protein
MEGNLKNGIFEIEDIVLGNFKAVIVDSRKWDCERFKREIIFL